MSWIKIIDYKSATGKLKLLYNRIKGPDDNVDNIMLSHSLRPHSMEGHLALYKNVLHHASNTLPKWYLESIGIIVSLMNRCDYCVKHHLAGLKRLVGNEPRFKELSWTLCHWETTNAFTQKEKAGLLYAEILTREPAEISKSHIEELRNSGFEDGEILEINQVASYFAYANRTVLGLGVNTDDDILGLSPSSNKSSDWSHR